VLRAVGVLDQLEARFIVKRGANFHDSATGKTSRYAFDDAFDKRVGSAFQVPRDEFDQVLLRHAESLGAEVREGWTVVRAFHESGEHGFEVRAPSGDTSRISARFVVDATGRDALFAHAARTTDKVPKLDRMQDRLIMPYRAVMGGVAGAATIPFGWQGVLAGALVGGFAAWFAQYTKHLTRPRTVPSDAVTNLMSLWEDLAVFAGALLTLLFSAVGYAVAGVSVVIYVRMRGRRRAKYRRLRGQP